MALNGFARLHGLMTVHMWHSLRVVITAGLVVFFFKAAWKIRSTDYLVWYKYPRRMREGLDSGKRICGRVLHSTLSMLVFQRAVDGVGQVPAWEHWHCPRSSLHVIECPECTCMSLQLLHDCRPRIDNAALQAAYLMAA